ncbi:hypothetical protein VTL71DRAFT_5922 [Oculimacula yallundae]|uniref:Uncharacterized protein n=1 Tax=Oculimacula yallundae TaxID=86028 RepID=A0ABR4BYV4_9HELO
MLPPTEAERRAIAKYLLCNDPASISKYSRYFKFYTSITCPSSSEATSIQVDNPAFNTHADILGCIEKLRMDPKMTRERFISAALPQEIVSLRDKDDATRTVVRVVFMLDCSKKDKYSEGFEISGYTPARWEPAESFSSYVQRAVPKSFRPYDKVSEFKAYKKDLKAWKLKKRHNLRFRPTDNIMEHLLYDPESRTVKVFHHTSYLKAHLARSADQPIDLDTHSSLTLGTLPPQLLWETLDSFHYILFPISLDESGKSQKLLSRLISKHDFDADSRWDEDHIRPLPSQFAYHYWGDRLAQLHAVVKNPPPANGVMSWFERHTSERNALTVAIIGLFLSALFGLLSVIVGGAQLWVAVVALNNSKETVSDPV